MSDDSQATLRTHDDGSYIRTAIVCDGSATLALVNADGELLALVNCFTKEDWLAVDVCDVTERFTNRRVLSFKDGVREDLDTGTVAAVDFRS